MLVPLQTFIFFLGILISPTWGASTSIDSTGSFNCAPNGDDATIKVTDFDFTFDKLTSSVAYTAKGTASKTVNATAKITLDIYGTTVATREVKFCEYGVTELCPIDKNSDVTITGNHTIPAKYVSSISQLAFTIPDIEGNIYIQLYDVADTQNKNELGCFRSDITNGNTTEVTSAKWGTAIAAIIALVVAMGSSASSSAGGGASPTDGGATAHAATGAGATGAEANAAGTAPAPTSGVGTNVAANGFHAPGLTVLLNWLQGMSLNGVYSVDYPKVYRSFTRNFSWTCGILEWTTLEESIDKMRKHTGGNLTLASVDILQQTTLYEDPLSVNSQNSLNNFVNNNASSVTKRFSELGKRYEHDFGFFTVIKRDSDSISQTASTGSGTSTSVTLYSKYVTGVEAYLEKNHIPFTNGFVTLLIWWCIIVLAIVVFMIGFKIALDLYYTEERLTRLQKEWDDYHVNLAKQDQEAENSNSINNDKMNRTSTGSRFLTRLSIIPALSHKSSSSSISTKRPSKPKFQGYKSNYKNYLRVTLIRVIVILYGVWVFLSFYQFRIGDSWASILLAALTFSAFTLILIAYSLRIWYLAYIASKKQAELDAASTNDAESNTATLVGAQSLFSHKPWINKYGVFYDEFKVKFWWVFIPILIAVFGRNAFISLGVGKPLVQIFGQLAIDVVLCAFFCVFTPFNTKMGNGLNILIQIVRIISLILTFLFTDVVSLSKIRSTVVGFILIALQAGLTVLLVLLIIANAFKGFLNGFYENQKTKYKWKKEQKLRQKNDFTEKRNLNDPDTDYDSTIGHKRPYSGDLIGLDDEDSGDHNNRNSIQLINLDSPNGSEIGDDDDDRLPDFEDYDPDNSSSFDKMMNIGNLRHGSIFVDPSTQPPPQTIPPTTSQHVIIDGQMESPLLSGGIQFMNNNSGSVFGDNNAIINSRPVTAGTGVSSNPHRTLTSSSDDDFNFLDINSNTQRFSGSHRSSGMEYHDAINDDDDDDEDFNKAITDSFKLPTGHGNDDDEAELDEDIRYMKQA